jgi:hypothetical protein
VSTPSGHRKVATVLAAAETLQASFRGADQPGLYHLLLPSAQDKGPETPLPWVVLGQSEESRLTSLTAADFDLVGKRLPLLHAQSTAELTSAITGRVPGREIWRLLALAALVGLLAEITLTRWIAQQRKAHKVQIVQFGHASASQQPTANSQQATATRQRRREATANRHKV